MGRWPPTPLGGGQEAVRFGARRQCIFQYTFLLASRPQPPGPPSTLICRRDRALDGQAAVVGVDVGKEKLYLVVRWSNGQTHRPVVVLQPEEIGLALQFLKRLSSGRTLQVAMEPSGTYGDAFRYACQGAGLSVFRVSPVASNRHAEVYDGVPSQHDGKDAGVIAELCGMGKSRPWPWREAREQEQRMAAHVTLLDNAWRGRLEGKLARHWPEVVFASPHGGLAKAASAAWIVAKTSPCFHSLDFARRELAVKRQLAIPSVVAIDNARP